MAGTEPFRLDRRAVARSFDRASDRYEVAGHRQGRISGELLERLQFFRLEPRVILDLGCAVGAGAAQLRRRFPRARVIALDLAYRMARQARRHQRFWRRFECVCADGRALPLAAQSVDLVFSNLMLHWSDDPVAVFAESQRVLRPGGLMLFSTLGPDTLHELRAAWARADALSHTSAFADMTQLASAMSHAGLSEPVMDRELEVSHYGEVRALMKELRALGATHAAVDRRRTLTGRNRLQAMIDAYEQLRTGEGIPASWEILYGAGFAGERPPGRAMPLGDEEFAVPVSSLRAPRRSA